MSVSLNHSDATQQFVLHGVSWDAYQQILEALPEHRLRHSYDGWNLTMMSPSQEHDWIKGRIGRLIEATATQLKLPIKSIGSTTLRRSGVKKGLEPDEAFYVAHEAQVRGKKRLDPDGDPPPDLAIEVDITNSSEDRQEIYAQLGVPEVWRYSDQRLIFWRLEADGYREVSQSIAFPFLESSYLSNLLKQAESWDDTSLIASHLDWLAAR